MTVCYSHASPRTKLTGPAVVNARNAQESFNQNKFQSFGMDFENQDLDDSGIGMSLMDDNIGTSKGYIGADASNNFTHGGMNVR